MSSSVVSLIDVFDQEIDSECDLEESSSFVPYVVSDSENEETEERMSQDPDRMSPDVMEALVQWACKEAELNYLVSLYEGDQPEWEEDEFEVEDYYYGEDCF